MTWKVACYATAGDLHVRAGICAWAAGTFFYTIDLGQKSWVISLAFPKSEFLGFCLSRWFGVPQKWVSPHILPVAPEEEKCCAGWPQRIMASGRQTPTNASYSRKRYVCGSGQRTWKTGKVIKSPKEGYSFVLHTHIQQGPPPTAGHSRSCGEAGTLKPATIQPAGYS